MNGLLFFWRVACNSRENCIRRHDRAIDTWHVMQLACKLVVRLSTCKQLVCWLRHNWQVQNIWDWSRELLAVHIDVILYFLLTIITCRLWATQIAKLRLKQCLTWCRASTLCYNTCTLKAFYEANPAAVVVFQFCSKHIEFILFDTTKKNVS